MPYAWVSPKWYSSPIALISVMVAMLLPEHEVAQYTDPLALGPLHLAGVIIRFAGFPEFLR
jgi:hypothetical protein